MKGDKNPFKGKTHTPETRAKIAQAAREAAARRKAAKEQAAKDKAEQ